MKKLLILILAISPTTVFSQKSTTNKTATVKKAVVSKTLAGSLIKRVDDNIYYFDEIPIKIDNGKSEEKTILFSCKISKYVWDDLKKDGATDQQVMNFLAMGLSMNAQFSLTNSLSFDPFKKQYFEEKDRKMICSYGMMARNGYGNLVETSVLAEFDPFKKYEKK